MQKSAETTCTSRRSIVQIGAAVAGAMLISPGLTRPVYAQQQRHPNPMPAELRKALERNPAVPVLGNPNGDITLSEFFDYNCSFCRANLADVQRLIGGDKKLRVVYREWPVFGDGSFFAAKASLASLKQGKYWQFHKAMMTMKGRAEEASVLRTAREVGLNIDQLRTDMEKPEVLDQIYETMDLADTMRLSGTPTFIAGHEAAFGRLSLSELKEMVAEARKYQL